jgi:pimeloyl-ACP methyl ester carboxylesterase
MNSYQEEIARFGPNNGLTGILTFPSSVGNGASPKGEGRPAVIILTAGLLHRVGPNRLYVKLARRLAAEGFSVLRFDFSGIGDSQPRADNLPMMEAAPSEVGDAMEYLAGRGIATHFLLAGHCSGALLSLLKSQSEPRVIGIVMINPEGGDQQWTDYDYAKKESQFYANYYGREALHDAERWRKFLTGKVNYGKIASNVVNGVIGQRLRSLRLRSKSGADAVDTVANEQARALAREYFAPLLERGGAMLLLFSAGSSGLTQWRAKLGAELPRMEQEYNLTLRLLPQSDHLLTPIESQMRACDEISNWARQFLAMPSHVIPSGRDRDA